MIKQYNHFFELFGLEARFDIDVKKLKETFRTLQRQVHPDLHPHANALEKKKWMLLSSDINLAFNTLFSPLMRAQYLCSVLFKECPFYDESAFTRQKLPAAFLMEQMDYRETFDAIISNPSVAEGQIASFREDVLSKMNAVEHELAIVFEKVALEEPTFIHIVELIMKLQFWAKLDNSALEQLQLREYHDAGDL